jgi:3-hydroxyacyl-[acyl-carrier-protein] dehydratase
MVPTLIFDISDLPDEPVLDAEAIERVNPHRGVMRLLDGVLRHNDDFSEGVTYRDVEPDEFWVEGHIPGRPLFPGVLMIEMAAQTASYFALRHLGAEGQFLGFVGAEGVKFRGQVVPGDQMLMLARKTSSRRNRFVCQTQGVVRGRLVFEGEITGMLM